MGSLTRSFKYLALSVITKGIPVEHSIEGRNFIHSHGWHRKKFGDVVHDADTCPSLVLSLCEVEQGDDGCFLVLGWVVGNDLIGPRQVVGSELKGNLSIEHRVNGAPEKYKKVLRTLGLLYAVSRCCPTRRWAFVWVHPERKVTYDEDGVGRPGGGL